MEHQKPAVISAQIVFEVRRIMPFGVMEIKWFLQACEPEFYARFMQAIRTQAPEPGHHFHDPIEDDVELRAQLEAAERETTEILRDSLIGTPIWVRRGTCHLHWHTKQQILREKHGIEWFTPAQMNPGIIFD